MYKKFPLFVAVLASILSLSSCKMESVYDEYDEWREQNDIWLDETDFSDYVKVSPDWAPDCQVFMKWHNDRSLTAGNLVPISTSTVDCKYEFEDITGKSLGNSYRVAAGDSVYQSQPNQNILGFWTALTQMHVGDSVTVVIPYQYAYGSQLRGSIKPYTNLIYHVKLKKIVDYEKPKS